MSSIAVHSIAAVTPAPPFAPSSAQGTRFPSSLGELADLWQTGAHGRQVPQFLAVPCTSKVLLS